MSILWAIIIGVLVGLVAKFLMPGRDPGGFLVTMLVGIGGALVANFLGRSLGWYHDGQTAGFIASVLGAMLLLILVRLVRRKPLAAGHAR